MVMFKITDVKYTNNVLGVPVISRDPGNITCGINRKEDKSYLNFNKGDTITVKGTFSAKFFKFYGLEDCVLDIY